MGAVFPSVMLGTCYVLYLVVYGKLWPDRAPLATASKAEAENNEQALPFRRF